MGFIEAGREAVVEDYLQALEPSAREDGHTLVARRLQSDLPDALSALLPLTTHQIRRVLFVPTTERWTAYFDNSSLGTDTGLKIPRGRHRLGTLGIRAVAVPDGMQSDA